MLVCRKVSELNYMLTFEDLDSYKKASKYAIPTSKHASKIEKHNFFSYQDNKGFIGENEILSKSVILEINSLVKESFA